MRTQLLLTALLVLIVGSGVSHATLITYQNNYTFATVGTTNIALPQFNPALGTLNSVTVYVYGTGQATFAADNDYGPAGIDATAFMQHDFLVTAPGVSANGGDSFSNTQTLSPDNGDGLGIFDPTGPDGYNWGTATVGEYQVAGSPIAISNTFWAAYQGAGSVLFGVNAQTFTSEISGAAPWFNPGTAFYLQNSVTNPSLNVRVKVDYDYTEGTYVPEPGTMCLLGLGLAGLGAWRRRKKS